MPSALKVDRLARELQASDKENDRLRKRMDELVTIWRICKAG